MPSTMSSGGTDPSFPKPSAASKSSAKNSLANLVAYNNSTQRALVPPVLRDVGKLAAGVASVSTSGCGDVAAATAGSATGNPRNKCALQPGHSLMDWIRLGSSGKDLTGVGPQAGKLSVTREELALHNAKTDAWLSIRGKVYNVTHYLPFHPGGPEELMRGVGKDATSLFDQVHPWVNYDQILQKCLLGRLVMVDPSKTASEKSIFDTDDDDAARSQKEPQQVQQQQSSTASTTTKGPPDSSSSPPTTTNEETTTTAGGGSSASAEPTLLLPRFDWIQQIDYITAIFYTGAFSNPAVEMHQANERSIGIVLTYNGCSYNNDIVFFKDIRWPGQIKVFCETGKVEVVFRKARGEIWDNYGVLRQTGRRTGSSAGDSRFKHLIVNKAPVNYNTVLLELERIDRKKIVVPLGNHVRVFETINGEEMTRSYTPVPNCLFKNYRIQTKTTDNICLMVKRYAEGNISKVLCDRDIGDFVTISKPIGSFNLQEIERRENFVILAAGTGITPMFSLILFLLERRIRKCQSLRLLFFNRTSNDIPFESQLAELQAEDARLKVEHVLSQPDKQWTGHRGHISRTMLEDVIAKQLKGTSYVQRDLYVMVCGPTIFTTLSHQILTDLKFGDDQYYLFLG